MASVFAKANPDVLRWARETASLSIEQAATNIDIDPGRLEDWEAGADRPTIPQLRRVAGVYRRPIAVFYLPAPPKDFTALKDFRRLPKTTARMSPQLAYAIRRAEERREVAIDLASELDAVPSRILLKASPTEDVVALAQRVRLLLGVPSTSSWTNCAANKSH